MNTSILNKCQDFVEQKAPHWTVSTGVFADKLKEWKDEEEECFVPIKEIPQRRPKSTDQEKYVRPAPPHNHKMGKTELLELFK